MDPQNNWQQMRKCFCISAIRTKLSMPHSSHCLQEHCWLFRSGGNRLLGTAHGLGIHPIYLAQTQLSLCYKLAANLFPVQMLIP